MERREKKSAIPLGRTLAIVVAVHVVGAAGLLLLAQTEYGQKVLKTYEVSLMQDEPPPPPPPEEEPPPPPPPPEPMEAPQIADVPHQAPAGPEIGASGGLQMGGRFLGPKDGPVGAFHAAVERVFRTHYQQPEGEFRPAELLFIVGASGRVEGYKLSRSSGDPAADRAVLVAAASVKRDGVARPPLEEGKRYRDVRIKVTPY